jgi:hypothetical protein
MKNPLASLFNRDPLRLEARHFERVLIRKLEQLNICYRFPKSQKDFLEKGVSRVSFSRCVATPEALYYQIDSIRLPRGVKLADIASEDVLDDLSVACGHPARFHYDTNGAWLILERDRGAFSIPSKLTFADVLKAWPTESRKSLIIPLGVGENRVIQFRSLAEMPHALIGGATGAGKTTFLHAWICGLFLHNDPAALRLALVDLKGGTEFTDYKTLPHVLTPEETGDEEEPGPSGFVKGPDEVIPLLSHLQQEMDYRLSRFEQAGGVRNLAEWNWKHRSQPWPRIVLFVDELAVIMYDKSLRKEAVPLLSDLTARGRAPGIHCVLSTQRPEVKVVDGQIKGNTDARFAFRMTDNASSRVILDTVEAAKFDDSTPLGRCIYRRGIDRYEVQAPLITTGQIAQFVKRTLSGEDAGDAATISPEQVLRDVLKRFEGTYAITTLYKFYEGEVSMNYLRTLAADMDNQTVEIDGVTYVLQQDAERKPRKLRPVEESTVYSEQQNPEKETP